MRDIRAGASKRSGQRWYRVAVLLAAWLLPCLAAQSEEGDPVWHPLFSGNRLTNWKPTNFGGEGEVKIKAGILTLEEGYPLSGITWQEKFPKSNYELELEACRKEGSDFFCGLTFPVADSHCSLILGGWGGSVVGLSSIDGKDASENATTQYIRFEQGKWYAVRVRVTTKHISVWLDGKRIIHQQVAGHKIGLRNEVDLSKPLGLAAFETIAQYRKARYRKLP